MDKLTVSAEPLRTILQALIGPPHHIRELQATRRLPASMAGNPIDVLIAEFNAAAEQCNATSTTQNGESV